MNFDRPGDTSPLLMDVAIARGKTLVNGPIPFIMGASLIVGLLLSAHRPLLGLAFIVLSFVPAWLWWSWSVPRWRAWAISRGVDPERLQEHAVRAKLVWPRGSIFERTEFRRD